MYTQRLQNVIQASLHVFQEGSTTLLPELGHLVSQLRAEDLNLHHSMRNLYRVSGWECDEIFHAQDLHISLFRIPAGQKIPLHNHPEMTVLLKALWGHMHIEGYDWAAEYPFTGLARKSVDQIIHGGSEACLVLPYANNVHSIEALEDAAFVDIFSPYYSEERICQYFDYKPAHGNLVQLIARN